MNYTKIIVKDIVNNALSNNDGVKLQMVIENALASGQPVYVSFHDIETISSSFLNSSLGNLIDNYGFDVLSKIKIIDYTQPVAAFIKKYVADLKSLTTQ